MPRNVLDFLTPLEKKENRQTFIESTIRKVGRLNFLPTRMIGAGRYTLRRLVYGNETMLA
jgi:hypothetical protein